MSGATDWRELSLSRLRFRYESIIEERWNHTAQLQATIINMNGGNVSVLDLHPARPKTVANPQRDDRELDRFIQYHQRKLNQK